MHDPPSPVQIAQAAERFLREWVAPALAEPGASEHLAFHARVAANLLAIAARELAEPAVVAQAERRRLQALLARQDSLAEPAEPADPAGAAAGPATAATPDLAALNRALADAIARGRLDERTPGLADHLWQVTLAKLAVDQPGYSTYLAHAQTDGAPR